MEAVDANIKVREVVEGMIQNKLVDFAKGARVDHQFIDKFLD